jgi:SAM-dependent methyltransferase
MTFFAGVTEAGWYARHRPAFHPLVVERIADKLGAGAEIPWALDVACGTGQSSLALKPLAARVVGLDVSRGMLALASGEPGVDYLHARAETVPLRSGSVSLITTACALHWFDRERFMAEALRVLGRAGWLVIYNNGFRGVMKENPAFEAWARQVYRERFPAPARDWRPLTGEDAARYGFRLVDEERFTNEVSFSAEALAGYLMTQTNVRAALNEGRETPGSVHAWLLQSLAPFFTGDDGTFLFGSVVWYLQNEESDG